MRFFALAQAAALGNPMFTRRGSPIHRLGPSYTVDTLRELAIRYPGSNPHLLIGADQPAALDTGHQAAAVSQARPGSLSPCGPGFLFLLDVGAPARRTSTGSRCRRSASPPRSCASACETGARSAYRVPSTRRELIEAEGLDRSRPGRRTRRLIPLEKPRICAHFPRVESAERLEESLALVERIAQIAAPARPRHRHPRHGRRGRVTTTS